MEDLVSLKHGKLFWTLRSLISNNFQMPCFYVLELRLSLKMIDYKISGLLLLLLYFLRVFHTSFNCFFFTGGWVTASLIRSLGFF